MELITVRSSIILTHLASLLRARQMRDRLISAGGGVPQYIQLVLIPELIVMLVKEDMKVDDEEARVIVAESDAMGLMLNGEEDEGDEVRKIAHKRKLEEERQRKGTIQSKA